MGNPRTKKYLPLFLAPIIGYLCLFFLYPVIYGIYISFYDYHLGNPVKKFVGIDNYTLAIKDSQFRGAWITTFIFVFVSVSIEMMLGIGGAFLLARENKIMRIIRTLILSPTVFAPLVVGLIWKALYQPDLGIISYYLRSLGIPIGRGLTVERSTALLSVILIDIWEWFPLVLIIVLAGLKNLPKEPYEAALVDGASGWQMIRYITLPLLRPFIVVALLVRLLDALKTFDTIWAVTGGGPGTATTVINLRIFEIGIHQLRTSYAAAMSNYLLMLSLVIGGVFVWMLYSKRYVTLI